MKKKIFIDILLNIFATAIPVVILQLWILPILSRGISDEKYGLMVTVVSFFNVLPGAAGNVLNNIRLIYAKDEEGKEETKDFNVILIALFIVSVVSTFVISLIYDKNITVIGLSLNIVIAVLFLLHEYYIVAFRLKIDYIQIVVSNGVLSIGYILGYVMFNTTGYWQFVYIAGYLFSCAYIMCKSTLWKEPLRISTRFKKISFDTFWLMFAGVLGRIVTYADKLLIFPILGGEIVAIYYAASIFGKIISMAISPISSVMLTYLSKLRKKNNGMFFFSLLSGGGACVLGYFVCICLSRPVLDLLYPQYVDEAMKYINITTGIAVMQTLISLVNPFVIRFMDIKWQAVVNGANAVIYVMLCMLMLRWWDLFGFCTGALVAGVIKLLMLIVIYLRCNARKELQEQTTCAEG